VKWEGGAFEKLAHCIYGRERRRKGVYIRKRIKGAAFQIGQIESIGMELELYGTHTKTYIAQVDSK
jgi:hypothetical protein